AYNALPNDLRTNYAKMKLEVCSNNTKILLLVIEHYKKSQTPPYSVTQSDLIKNISTKIKL
ncbi:thiopurine S-methyltransferase, partial [Francisella tularensis subsp. holarctica]|nr:thiopurine S-methyltransferase [Francisella tularensis subsp. holarctica]